MISYQTRLYKCPFCSGGSPFVVDHPLELSRHMLTEHEIYFRDYVAVITVDKVSDIPPIEVKRYEKASDE